LPDGVVSVSDGVGVPEPASALVRSVAWAKGASN
jgi:hypothetical protein